MEGCHMAEIISAQELKTRRRVINGKGWMRMRCASSLQLFGVHVNASVCVSHQRQVKP